MALKTELPLLWGTVGKL